MMLRRPILGLLVSLIGGCAFGQSICSARTPEQAVPWQWRVQGSGKAISPNPRARSSRYRLARIVVDPELHRRWALIANCTHPEFPLQTVALAAGPAAATPTHAPDASSKSTSGPDEATLGSSGRVPSRSSATHAAISIVPSASASKTRNFTALIAPVSSARAVSSTFPLVRAGDLVHLWSSGSNVHLEMEVVSLEYGRAGQVIHLRRPGQTALLAGVVVGKDSAELVP